MDDRMNAFKLDKKDECLCLVHPVFTIDVHFENTINTHRVTPCCHSYLIMVFTMLTLLIILSSIGEGNQSPSYRGVPKTQAKVTPDTVSATAVTTISKPGGVKLSPANKSISFIKRAQASGNRIESIRHHHVNHSKKEPTEKNSPSQPTEVKTDQFNNIIVTRLDSETTSNMEADHSEEVTSQPSNAYETTSLIGVTGTTPSEVSLPPTATPVEEEVMITASPTTPFEEEVIITAPPTTPFEEEVIITAPPTTPLEEEVIITAPPTNPLPEEVSTTPPLMTPESEELIITPPPTTTTTIPEEVTTTPIPSTTMLPEEIITTPISTAVITPEEANTTIAQHSIVNEQWKSVSVSQTSSGKKSHTPHSRTVKTTHIPHNRQWTKSPHEKSKAVPVHDTTSSEKVTTASNPDAGTVSNDKMKPTVYSHRGSTHEKGLSVKMNQPRQTMSLGVGSTVYASKKMNTNQTPHPIESVYNKGPKLNSEPEGAKLDMERDYITSEKMETSTIRELGSTQKYKSTSIPKSGDTAWNLRDESANRMDAAKRSNLSRPPSIMKLEVLPHNNDASPETNTLNPKSKATNTPIKMKTGQYGKPTMETTVSLFPKNPDGKETQNKLTLSKTQETAANRADTRRHSSKGMKLSFEEGDIPEESEEHPYDQEAISKVHQPPRTTKRPSAMISQQEAIRNSKFEQFYKNADLAGREYGDTSKPLPDSNGGSSTQCVATVPRLNLHLEKMLGQWYPAKVSSTTSKLWVQSFKKEHNISDIACLTMEYSMTWKTSDNEPDTLVLSLHHVNESTRVEAMFVGDDKHPKESIWAISWPNGEDTLTSVVAAGVIGKERNRYNWLLTVDCDLNGIVEPDWAVMARIPEGISNSTLATILAIVEGLKGLTVEDAITYQSDDCHE